MEMDVKVDSPPTHQEQCIIYSDPLDDLDVVPFAPKYYWG